MASETSGAYFTANAVVDNTAAATFIPEIWSDEVIAAYEKNLVVAPLVKKMSMVGKKGDTIHVPAPTRGSANAKAEATAVTIQANLESEVQVVIDKHYEYSRLIEDITTTQGLASLRQFYTSDAGYALAKQVDDDLYSLGQAFGDHNGTITDWVHSNCYFNDATNGTSAYAIDTVIGGTDVFTDAFFRDMVQKMDDADTPMDNRFFLIPPSLRNAIMGIDRYVSTDFVNNKGVANGKIGNLYGIDIYVSSNVPVIETAAANAVSATDTRGAILAHKDTMVLAEQKGVRSQTQYKQEYLANLYTADRIYGVKAVRPETGFVLAVGD